MIEEAFKLDNQLCFRLYTASRLLTQAYHPLLSKYGLTYPQYLVLLERGAQDARQMIVSLTPAGRELKNKLAEVPLTVGNAVICDRFTPEMAPELFRMLDDIIAKLSR